MDHTKLSDVTEPRVSINPNRLHLLISVMCGVIALAYGAHLLSVGYAPFANSFTERRQIEAIERSTGKPYTEWQKDKAIYCSKQVADTQDLGSGIFAFDPRGQGEIQYQACMNPVFDVIPNAEVRTAFIKATLLPASAYAVGAIVSAWLIGFLLAKAIPAGSNRLWVWLTSGGRSK